MLCLFAATALSWAIASFNDELLALALVLFGLGFIAANHKYERYKLSSLVIVAAFFVIYIWGTLPFYLLGDLLYGRNMFITQIFGFFGAFLLVILMVRLNFTGVRIGAVPVIMMLLFPFIATVLLSYIINREFFILKPGDVVTNFIPAMAIVQVLMSVNIVSALKSEGEIIKI